MGSNYREIKDVIIKGVPLKDILDNHLQLLNQMNHNDLKALLTKDTDLENADLSYVDLSYTHLEYTNMRNTILDSTICYHTDFSHAHMNGVSFKEAKINYANFNHTDMPSSILDKSCIKRSFFKEIYMPSSSLQSTHITDSIFHKIDLRYSNADHLMLLNSFIAESFLEFKSINDAEFYSNTIVNSKLSSNINAVLDRYSYIPFCCPNTGSFIGYKKARVHDTIADVPHIDDSDFFYCFDDIYRAVIIKLLIPEDAKRSSASGRKCRCNKAKVLDITSLDGSLHFDSAISMTDIEFEYKVGEMVSVDNFNECRWNECAAGIHFFIDRQEAINY